MVQIVGGDSIAYHQRGERAVGSECLCLTGRILTSVTATGATRASKQTACKFFCPELCPVPSRPPSVQQQARANPDLDNVLVSYRRHHCAPIREARALDDDTNLSGAMGIC